MILTQEQVEKLLRWLSKLSVEDSAKFTQDINAIIGYMKILDEVDTTDVIPTVSVVQKQNILRPDMQQAKTIHPHELLECSHQKIIADQISINNIMK